MPNQAKLEISIKVSDEHIRVEDLASLGQSIDSRSRRAVNRDARIHALDEASEGAGQFA